MPRSDKISEKLCEIFVEEVSGKICPEIMFPAKKFQNRSKFSRDFTNRERRPGSVRRLCPESFALGPETRFDRLSCVFENHGFQLTPTFWVEKNFRRLGCPHLRLKSWIRQPEPSDFRVARHILAPGLESRSMMQMFWTIWYFQKYKRCTLK